MAHTIVEFEGSEYDVYYDHTPAEASTGLGESITIRRITGIMDDTNLKQEFDNLGHLEDFEDLVWHEIDQLR